MDLRFLNKVRRTAGPLELDHIESFAQGRISRRDFVTRGTVLGMGLPLLGAIVTACGSSSPKAGPATTAATKATDAATTTTAGPSTTKAAPAATTAAPAGAPAGFKAGGTLKVAAQTPGGPLDPVAMENLGSYTIVTVCFEYLCGPGEGAELVPMLAESWKPNADASEWTFTLRKGVKWHDGSPFTADDVVATMDRLAGSNLKASIAAGSTKATDATTVVMKLVAPNGQFPYLVSHWNPQSVITPKSFVLGTTLDKVKTGTGPFKLTDYNPDTGCAFARNDDWWGGKPILDKVEFIFSQDIAVQMSGLQAGAADAAVQFSVLDGKAILDDTKKFTVETIRGSGHRQIWFNVRDEGPFKDKRVRQAVALGIDRQALVDNVLQGRGDIANDHPIAPIYPFFDKSQPQRKRDIAKAKQLLADAGKTGLKATLVVGKLQEIPQLAELIQSQLKEIGMEVTLDVVENKVHYDRWCKVYDSKVEPAGCDGGTDFGLVDYGNRGTPDVYLTKAYSTGEWNSAHFNNPEFNALVKEYQAALTNEGRAKAIAKIQVIANEEVPYVIPYFLNAGMAYSTKVKGIKPTGLGHYYLGKAGFVA
jgi:peptide/nickel transport system substrate-binding protein